MDHLLCFVQRPQGRKIVQYTLSVTAQFLVWNNLALRCHQTLKDNKDIVMTCTWKQTDASARVMILDTGYSSALNYCTHGSTWPSGDQFPSDH